MALILNLDTSTKNCSVSVAKDGELFILCEEATDGYQHAEKLHIFIQWALEAEDLTLEQIDAIAVGKGPGSYTGLRIGVSAAKGLCFALEKPLISVNSLEIMAQADVGDFDYIIPMTDARRKEVYTAIFDKNLQCLSPTEAKILDETSYHNLTEKKLVFVGDGVQKASEILNLPNARFIPEILPSAKNMCRLVEQKFNAKAFEDVAYFEPFYLKDFVVGN